MNFLKKYWIGIVIAIVLIIAVILILKKRNAQNSLMNRETQTGYRQTFTVGRFDHKPGQEVAVTLVDRPTMGTIVEGDTILLENVGPYSGTFTVKQPWEDGAGKLGALFIDVPGSENMPDTTSEYSYMNLGKMHLI